MIVIPIVIPPGSAMTTRLPEMNRLDFPELKPGDLVGVLRHEGRWPSPVAWCWYLYVVPKDENLYYPGMEGRIARYWGSENLGFAATKWGAKRKLAAAVRRYRDGMKQEIEQMPL